ncbi:DUF6119 family protein [Nocardia sp. NPDC006044]|uniref:DUF6119 family protein n=1 Tax=Nocardia sp. NPDC006044 TaxID=3364306 RepID=UPI0036C63416
MRVTVYLLRESADLSGESLRRPSGYKERPLIPAEDGVRWRLFVYQGCDKPVCWHDYLVPLLDPADDDEPITGRSAGAVLLVEAHARLFAITFGYGFQAIDKSLIEHDFGLKVAANSIDPDRVNLADTRGLGRGRRNATSRLPTPNEVFALGLLTDEEWIRRFGGEVKIPGFAKTVSGSDALQLNVDSFDFTALSDKLGRVLELYRSDDYTSIFPFLDYFRRETDKEKIAELDTLIGEAIRDRDCEVGFALPDDADVAADLFRVSRRRAGEIVTELLAEDVYSAIDDVDGWADPLNAVKVQAFDSGGEPINEREPLRNYVVGSVRSNLNGRPQDYALTAGTWIRINNDYVELVNRYMRDSIVDMTRDLDLPTWDDQLLLEENIPGNYGEERYNNWLGQELPDAIVLDRQLYRDRPGVKIEVCDVLTRDKKLLCVKRMDGSDKMSHLFQQGSLSARMLLDDNDYRERVMNDLRRLDPSAEFGSASEWTVVYAIATSKEGDLGDIMYFFSRAALKMHGEAVGGRGFKVAIAKVRHTALVK